MSDSPSTDGFWPPSRWVTLAVALVVLVPATWFGVRKWLINDTSEAVSTDEALAEFRDTVGATTVSSTAAGDVGQPATETTAPTEATDPAPATPEASAVPVITEPAPTTVPSPVFALPAPGVYRYATTGFEEIDAVGGAHHDYPDETAITVVPDGCGVRLRWDALHERREEWVLCLTADGVEIQPDSVQYHEFFGQGEEEPVECARGVLVVSADPGAPATTDQDCFRVDEAWLPVWEVIELTSATVDGDTVDVVHVRQQVVDEDEYWEYTTIDWYLALDGLPVRVTSVKESNSPTFVGDVEYAEEYELTLLSTVPLT